MPEPAKSSKKTNPHIRAKTTEIVFFDLTEDIKTLTEVQKVNQKVVLSFYGNKIDMPFKVITGFKPVKLTKELAKITDSAHEVVDSYKVEIEHPLGLTYFRMDVPRILTASQMSGDAFAIAELNIQSKREFEDYLINRKQYDLDFSTMDLGHRQARLSRKYEYINRGIDLAMGALSFGVSAFKGAHTVAGILKSSRERADAIYAEQVRQAPTWAYVRNHIDPKRKKYAPIAYKNKEMSMTMALGAYKGISGIASGITGLISASERAALQEEGFDLEIKNKALQSYQIDLGYERQKEDQLLTMRRIFANETFNDISSRKRQQLLDKLEKTKVEDIYLEVWTTSGEQETFVSDYHDKFGVDCRLAKREIFIRDEMPLGIYCIEDVVIENLSDRIDFEYLRTRLTGGIKFVEWVEHELVKDLSPCDIRVQEVQVELNREKEKTLKLESTIKEKDLEIAKEKETSNNFQNKYHELSDNFRKKEAELQEQTNLAVLYKNESIHLKQDLLKESSKHAQEKEDHSGTKEQLEQQKKNYEAQLKQKDQQLTNQKRDRDWWWSQGQLKQQAERERDQARQQLQQCTTEKEAVTQEKNNVTLQVDRQIQELQQKEQQINSLNQELATCKQGKATAERERDRLRNELDVAKRTSTSCPTPIDKIDATYIFVACGALRSGLGIALAKLDENRKIWVRDNSKKVMANTNARQVKLVASSEKTVEGFPYTVFNKANYDVAKGFKSLSPEINDNSRQVENGIPYVNSFPTRNVTIDSLKATRLACTRWYKDGVWSHNQVEGATEVATYGQYLNIMGLDLKSDLKAYPAVEVLTENLRAKERELEETKNTLQGVRTIKEQLEGEAKEEIWNKDTFKQVMYYKSLTDKGGKVIYPYVITGGVTEGDNKIYVCQFVEKTMCYVYQPNIVVRKYDSYWLMRITDSSDLQALERNYPLNNWASYWGRGITTWRDLWVNAFKEGDYHNTQTHMWSTNLPIRMLDPKSAFPCFFSTPISKEDKPIGNIFYYTDNKWRGSDYSVEGVKTSYKKITNYGEYLNAMGLEAVVERGSIQRVVAKKKVRAVA